MAKSPFIGLLKLMMVSTLLSLSLGFRIDGGEGSNSGIFGESGFNAVPRIGRRSMATNPFNSRFRFRFNNNNNLWGGRGGGSTAGFRFQDGGTFDPNGFLLRKRMAESIQMAKRDLEERENAAAAATSVASAVKQAGAGAKLNDEEQQADDITRFAVADEYWKEYLNDVARRKALAALSQRKDYVADKPYGMKYGNPLPMYLDRGHELAGNPALQELKFNAVRPMLRTNY